MNTVVVKNETRPRSRSGSEHPRIVLIDDHLLFAEGLRAQLREITPENHVDIVGEAGRFVRNLAMLPRVDLIIADLHMPDVNGVELISRIHQHNEKIPILIVSANHDLRVIETAIEAGAYGYVSKASSVTVMLEAVRSLLDGHRFMDPSLPGKVVDDQNPDAASKPSIPPRTLQVLEHMAKGMSNKAIADLLGISEATVKWHITRLFSTLAVRNRTSCVNKALQFGLISSAVG